VRRTRSSAKAAAAPAAADPDRDSDSASASASVPSSVSRARSRSRGRSPAPRSEAAPSEPELRRRDVDRSSDANSAAASAAAAAVSDAKAPAAGGPAAPTADNAVKGPTAASDGAVGWRPYVVLLVRFALILTLFIVLNHYFTRWVLDPILRPGMARDPAELKARKRAQILSRLCPPGVYASLLRRLPLCCADLLVLSLRVRRECNYNLPDDF
jgi:hypothetical protein